MTYTVSTSGMQCYITAKNHSETFSTLNDATSAFEYQCNRLGYDNVEKYEDGNLVAGGIGYDYRIELSANQ